MTDYPSQWESDVVLADGGTVRLRPVRARDAPALLKLYEELSDESVYLRFFSPVPRPTAAQLERLTAVDYVDHMALVAQLGDSLVAIARYDRVGAERAEVAFTVRDDQQGRGLGTLLLEHLAVVARANGVRLFSADTLPTNTRMLGVFKDAGWHAEHRFADGAVHVEFPIAPTRSSIDAVEARESLAEAASMARLLAPRSIAVIGASRVPGTIGNAVFRNLLTFGFQGPVYPVNPSSTSVAGVRAYATVLEVPDAVDVAIIVVPARSVRDVLEQCAAKRMYGVVIISAGFAEASAGGGELQREIVAVARSHGMRIVGPNCLGVVNTAPTVRMDATFAPALPVPGHVAFLSQSGGLGIEIMARAGDLGIGISEFVSVGNKADVSGNDLLQHWETDPNTDVILFYLESFGNPRKFARLAAAHGPPQTDRGGQERPHDRRQPRRVVAHGRARDARCRRRRPVPADGSDPRRHARGAARHCATAVDAAAAAGKACGDRVERGRARHPRRGRMRGRGARGRRARTCDPGRTARVRCW